MTRYQWHDHSTYITLGIYCLTVLSIMYGSCLLPLSKIITPNVRYTFTDPVQRRVPSDQFFVSDIIIYPYKIVTCHNY